MLLLLFAAMVVLALGRRRWHRQDGSPEPDMLDRPRWCQPNGGPLLPEVSPDAVQLPLEPDEGDDADEAEEAEEPDQADEAHRPEETGPEQELPPPEWTPAPELASQPPPESELASGSHPAPLPEPASPGSADQVCADPPVGTAIDTATGTAGAASEPIDTRLTVDTTVVIRRRRTGRVR